MTWSEYVAVAEEQAGSLAVKPGAETPGAVAQETLAENVAPEAILQVTVKVVGTPTVLIVGGMLSTTFTV